MRWIPVPFRAPDDGQFITLRAGRLIVAVALGVGTIVERSVLVFTVLKLAGAAYLVHLGVEAWRQRGPLQAAFTADRATRGGLRTLWEGFAVGVANPKTKKRRTRGLSSGIGFGGNDSARSMRAVARTGRRSCPVRRAECWRRWGWGQPRKPSIRR